MRLLVVGAGATGGYFGGRLAQAGRDVTFLVRPKRAEQLRAHGLQLVSPSGNATLTPQLVVTGQLAQAYDLILFAVKGFGLSQAIEDMAPAVGRDTMIVPTLNGMRHIDLLVSRFGEAAVLGGVCLVATTLDDQGRILQLADFQELVYGERTDTHSARVDAVTATLQNAGFQARASDHIMQEMWNKWIFLASIGAITCLLRGTIGDIVAAPGGAALARQALDECVAIATKLGYPPDAAYVTRTATTLTTEGSTLAPSMYRDLQQGHNVEADQIVGDLLERARHAGVAAPLLSAAFTHLKVYQHWLASGATS